MELSLSRASISAKGTQRNRHWRPMGRRVVFAVSCCITSRRRIAWRSLRPPLDISDWRGIFAIASAACGLSQSIGQLIVARAVQGIGGALLVPGSLAIISASFGEDQRGKAIGTWSGFSAITTAIGPVLGGWLVEHVSWRAVFFINIPIAIAVVVISIRHVPESATGRTWSLEWIGAASATRRLAELFTVSSNHRVSDSQIQL